MTTTRHQPAAQNSALIDTAVRILAALSTTPYFRDDSPQRLADIAWERAGALWDLIDRQSAHRPSDSRVPDAEDAYDPSEAERMHLDTSPPAALPPVTETGGWMP